MVDLLTISLVVRSQNFREIKIFGKNARRIENWLLKPIVSALVSESLLLDEREVPGELDPGTCQPGRGLNESQTLHVNG